MFLLPLLDCICASFQCLVMAFYFVLVVVPSYFCFLILIHVFNFYQIDGQDGGYEHSISSANEVSVEIVLYISV